MCPGAFHSCTTHFMYHRNGSKHCCSHVKVTSNKSNLQFYIAPFSSKQKKLSDTVLAYQQLCWCYVCIVAWCILLGLLRQGQTSELRKLWKTIILGVQLITSGFTYTLQLLKKMLRNKKMLNRLMPMKQGKELNLQQ